MAATELGNCLFLNHFLESLGSNATKFVERRVWVSTKPWQLAEPSELKVNTFFEFLSVRHRFIKENKLLWGELIKKHGYCGIFSRASSLERAEGRGLRCHVSFKDKNSPG